MIEPRTEQAVALPAVRRWLPAVYLLSFAVLGGTVPYLALVLRHRGLGGSWLALAMAALPFGRLVGAPLSSFLVDRYQAPGVALRVGAALATVGLAAILGAPTWLVPAAVLLYALGRAPMGPVVDALTLQSLRGDRAAYGRVRRWGSVGFLVSTLVAAALSDRIGLSPIAYSAGVSILLVLLVMRLPAPDRMERVALAPALRELGRDRCFRWLLIAAALHFAAHVAFTSFLAVHMEALGARTTWTGAALALGVAVEVLVMSLGPRLVRRFSPRAIYLAAIALAAPRWWLTAVVSDPRLVVALQALHGITFGAFWLSGVAWVAERAPACITTSAQGLFASAVAGMGALVGMAGASWIISLTTTHDLFRVATGVAVLALLAGLRAGAWATIRR